MQSLSRSTYMIDVCRDDFRRRLSNLCIDGNVLEFSGTLPYTESSQILSALTVHGWVMHLVELDSKHGLIVCEDPTAAQRILENSPFLVDGSTIRLSKYRPR